MKISLDQSGCIGCEFCTEIAPDVFAMDDNALAFVKQQPDEITDETRDAAESCPTGVIEITEEEE